jgi:hypothetical protein
VDAGKIEFSFLMKNISPHQPSHLSPYAQACLNALVNANLAERISIGGALGLFHYLDYRSTHDVDAWWAESLTEVQRKEVCQALERTLFAYGSVRTQLGRCGQRGIIYGWKNNIQLSNRIAFNTARRAFLGGLD